MGIDIQRDILGLKGQRVNEIKLNEEEQQRVILIRFMPLPERSHRHGGDYLDLMTARRCQTSPVVGSGE